MTYTLPVVAQYVTKQAHEAAINARLTDVRNLIDALTGGVRVVGAWSAASGAFPTTGGSGPAGVIRAGDAWVVIAGGTVDGQAFAHADRLIALTDAPGATYAGAWLRAPYADLIEDLRSQFGAEPAYATFALAQVADVPAAFQTIRVLGYDHPGVGGGLYERVALATTAPGTLRTADRFTAAGATDATNGGHWRLRDRAPTPEQFGSPTDGVTNALTAILALRDYCVAEKVPLHLICPNGYAISGEIRIDTGDFTMIGANTGRPSLRALAAEARVAVGRAAQCRLVGVNFDGKHPTTGVKTATNAYVSLPRGGAGAEEDSGITGSNSFTLDQCYGRDTLGAVLVVGRDSTEVKVWGGQLQGAGRVVEFEEDGFTKTVGAARFPDGNPPVVDWRGNGSMVGTVVAGCPGYAIEVSAGPADVFGIFEEVQLRARNVRAQNGFLGLLRVRDWEGDGTRAAAVSAGTIATGRVGVVWSGGYKENPGTVQDATTSGGSTVTGGSSDDVTVILAEGDVALRLEAPAKIQARGARALIRARDGAVVYADMRATEVLAQQLGNTSTTRAVIDCDELSSVHLPGWPKWAGTRNVLAADPDDALEPDPAPQSGKTPAYGRTQLVVGPGGTGDRGVHVPHGPVLAAVVDGSTDAAVASAAGYDSTTHTAALGSGTGAQLPVTATCDELGAVLRVTGRTSAASVTALLHPINLRPEWLGIELMVEVLAVFIQTAAEWTEIGCNLEVFDPAAILATAPPYYRVTNAQVAAMTAGEKTAAQAGNNTVAHPTRDKIMPVHHNTQSVTVAAPGGLNARGPIIRTRVFFTPQRPTGVIAARWRPRGAPSVAPYQCDYIMTVRPAGDRRPAGGRDF